MSRRHSRAVLVSAAASCVWFAQAAKAISTTYVWGGSTGNWSVPANWTKNAAPPGNNTLDSLVFAGAGFSSKNDLTSPNPATFAGIFSTFNSGAFTITGNPIALATSLPGGSGGQISQSSSGVVTIGNNLVISGQTLFAGVAGAGNVILNGAISGAGSFYEQGASTFVLTNTNTYTGQTTISSGILQIGNYSPSQPFSGTTGSILGNVVDNGNLLFDRTDQTTFAGFISGSGSLTTANGRLVLTNNNAYTGTTSIFYGISSGPLDQGLQIGDGGTTGYIASQSIVNNSNLFFDRSDSITYSGIISGNGFVGNIGSGTLVLTNDNTYDSNYFSISAGTLQLGNGGTTGSVAGQIEDESALVYDRSGDVTANQIFGSGSVKNAGFGKLIFAQQMYYTGNTTSNGIIQISAPIASQMVTAHDVYFTSPNTLTFGGILSTGRLVQYGPGTVILTNTDAVPNTSIVAGTLQIGNGGTSGSIDSSLILNYGTLAYDRSDAATFAGFIEGTGSVNNLGGLLIFSNDNVYTGATIISAGTLQLGTAERPGRSPR